MTPEKYNQVKQIFLAACDKRPEERAAFVASASAGDDEIRREVESLLREHQSQAPLLPSNPEGPLGPMSAILSHAGINVDTGHVGAHSPGAESPHAAADVPGVPSLAAEPTHPHLADDDAHDQTSATRSGIVDPGRFPAGSIIAGRYRIIELLGRGGMGEVYRADDITLNQSVALKFLPALFGNDAKWLERFRNEVRLSRQVTHPNVCRVFDIGEYQGEQFISMEYVDGENLASLLRRIGRVPHDKAILLARQLCAGLAAAHDKGVLHRDLKPANVMIDGRGSVRITDFGLAAPVDQIKTDAVRAGTPAYMSPEQLRGKVMTVRSDVYSLGLVLYEMFTGRRVFRAESLRDYQKLHSSEEPTPPSQIIEDIDPIVDRVILKCLEKDPKDRPAGAMAVSAALPGGNPLREILAAGETPSPEVVAAAGEVGAMKPRLAWTLLLAALACLIGFVYAAPGVFVIQRALYNRSPSGAEVQADPDILQYRARDVLASIGYPQTLARARLAPRDHAWGFELDDAYYRFVRENRSGLWRLWRPRDGLVYFWYRQSPTLLLPQRADGAIAENDPATNVPGMISLRLNPSGNLVRLEAQPLQPAESVTAARVAEPSPPATSGPAATTSSSAPDWSRLFEAAGLSPESAQWQPAAPQGSPPVFCDTRAAWTGRYRTRGNLSPESFRIEAASLHGLPVYFAAIGEHPSDALSETAARLENAGPNILIQAAVIAALLVVGSYLAWRNFRSQRGDRLGARRMAGAFFVLGAIAWLFSAHHVPNLVAEFAIFRRGMGSVLYSAGLIWVFYMALEPYVRRVWPETVISWTRLLSGKWIDPLVGRDVLAGASIGIMTTLLSFVDFQMPQWFGEARFAVPFPSIASATLMLRATHNVGMLCDTALIALYSGLTLLLCLVLIRMVTRRPWLTSLLAILFFAVATAPYREGEFLQIGNAVALVLQGILGLALLLALIRHGLVALIFCLLARALLLDYPVTWDFAAWYRAASLAGIVPSILILGASFYATLGGRALFSPRTDK
jgi:hypothetical protein